MTTKLTKKGKPCPCKSQASETGATLSYGADGLPPGLAINSVTGLISGTISTWGGTGRALLCDGHGQRWDLQQHGELQLEHASGDYAGRSRVQNPGSQTSYAGQSVSLTINATDAAGYALDYNADNLPDGLSIDPNTGIISGTIADDAVSTRLTRFR